MGYRARPTVQEVFDDNMFSDLRACLPPQQWQHKQIPAIDDVREALDVELRHQMEAMRHHDALLRSGSLQSDSIDVEKDEANVKASVHRVCEQVRAELDRC